MTRAIALALLLFPPIFAEAAHYRIQPNESNRLELRVAKTGLYRGKVHVFVFPQYSGTLDYDPQKPESSRVSFTLVVKDIKLTDTWLSEKDFKSVQEYALKDMLDAERYPEITFASADVKFLSAAQFEMRGALTIRGISKPASVLVTIEPGSSAPRFQGQSTVRLTDYGLKPPKAALGLIGTENDMKFSFSLIAVP